MKKRIIVAILLLTLLLPACTTYATPDIRYCFYDYVKEALYVFSDYDIKEDLKTTDLGIYVNDTKFSIIKDNDTDNLDSINNQNIPKFGIGLQAPVEVFKNIKVTPYASYQDGTTKKGEKVSYDCASNTVIRPRLVMFEDFSDNKADNITLKQYTDARCEIADYDNEEGISKKMLILSDNSTSLSSTATINVPDYTDKLTMEIKFKMERTGTDGFGFIMYFTDEAGKWLFRLVKYSGKNNGITYVNNGKEVTFTGNIDFDGEWVTMKVCLDSLVRGTSVSVEGNLFKNDLSSQLYKHDYVWQDMINGKVYAYNRTWYNESIGNKLKTVQFSTYGSTKGNYYIDYIKFTETTEDMTPNRVRAPGKICETIKDPSI